MRFAQLNSECLAIIAILAVLAVIRIVIIYDDYWGFLQLFKGYRVTTSAVSTFHSVSSSCVWYVSAVMGPLRGCSIAV